MTAKKRSEKRQRPVLRYVRLSRAEDAIVVAKAAGNISGFLRALALDKRLAPSAIDREAITRLMRSLADIRSELGKSGSNLNQLAKYANMDRTLAGSIAAAIEEHEQALRTLEEIRLACMQALGHERERKSKD